MLSSWEKGWPGARSAQQEPRQQSGVQRDLFRRITVWPPTVITGT